jgi:predicted TIM-barrel fold metal-dependent hydrolase
VTTKRWQMPLPSLNDAEGDAIPAGLGPVVDAHVHLFPDRLFEAIWRWFDRYGWPIRYKLHTPDVIAFALARGVDRIVALHYAHKPGLARGMNAYMAGIVRQHPRVTGLATVFPGEPHAKAILEDAFAAGLAGVKLHCHVQGFGVDDDSLAEIYETCILHDRPVLIHAGREPSSTGYQNDPHRLCHADRTAVTLRSYPRLRLGIPHLGIDELDAYGRLVEQHDNLWLDTTMALADYFPGDEKSFRVVEARPERIMYGTDFPNIPYAWDREIKRLAARRLPEAALRSVLSETAQGFYRFEP